ncbi:hypothetical protein ABIF94_002462 [Bradyrhizobium ottawaense]|uniref:hypothetical protein n=1 Tax=Bradyrhizobium ottawaense TaxID=931866 RepID=UPI003837F2FC
MAGTTHPTAEELLGHHLAYEIDQMVASLTMLGRVEVPSGLDPKEHWQQALNNALMESFYVHARALFEFFKKSRGAQQYAVSGYQPFKGVDTGDWIKRLNNQASHLLDGRTANDGLKIDGKERHEMLDALRIEVDAFKKALKPEFSHITIPSIPPVFVRVAGTPGATGVFGEIKR